MPILELTTPIGAPIERVFGVRRFLVVRNEVIRSIAESNRWQRFLPDGGPG